MTLTPEPCTDTTRRASRAATMRPASRTGTTCRAPALLLLALLLASVLVPTARAQSLYADPRARQAGDVVTVILNERTSASRSSAYENRSSASMGGDASIDGGTTTGSFGLDAAFAKDAQNVNETAQSELLSGTMTARVVGTDEVGNLLIAGERRLNVNGVTHLMRVSGVVRPFDVRFDNTLFSSQIADAEVEYRRAGVARRFLKPATLTKVGLLGVLGAAVVFGLQQ